MQKKIPSWNKKNIILIGMPGVGKSTIGVISAKILGMRFVDTDLLIQDQEERLLSEILEEEGVDGFLAIEERVLSEIKVRSSIIATGGSAVYGRKAMAHLKQIGTIVYLKLDYAHLQERLSDLKNRGVVLKKGQTLMDLYQERIPLYESYADLIIDEGGMTIEETVKALKEKLLPLGKG